MGLSENSVPLNPMVLLIIIHIKWLFHWEYTLFSDKPIYIILIIHHINYGKSPFSMGKSTISMVIFNHIFPKVQHHLISRQEISPETHLLPDELRPKEGAFGILDHFFAENGGSMGITWGLTGLTMFNYEKSSKLGVHHEDWGSYH
jgi:hypothetical protein